MLGLENKIVAIAGGSRGIGRATAERFAQAGASVVIGSRTETEFTEAADSIRKMGTTALGLPLDVTSKESVQQFFNRIDQEFGRLDVLVYCSGMNRRVPAEAYPEDAWDQVLSTNLKGAYLCCQEAGQRMIQQKDGAIVTITSMTSHIATPNQSAYAATKGGLLQYTKVLAVEWGKHNIRVNAVSPGYIETALNANNFRNETFRNNVLNQMPMGRFGGTEEIANAACFLASPMASYITGACLPVDGGFLAGHPNIIMQ
ncbi:SDR family NAD(P)-dependent oxidoreductase [Paenibacillus cremeus]|uniref:SDR family oxidoreductase n=1 Tax=Paenibacillus cremeus TaxID=2163881 RepID=A0A559K9W7_9BACL|nr:SDR family oxidoreductase [Paenibacillus cremeus]TVY08931.1 SDR family oxidoreductase [Paenibacillus cremeus]